jgi:hypothetical protein
MELIEEIQCTHIRDQHQKPYAALDIGDKRVVIICEQCYQRFGYGVLKEALGELVKLFTEDSLKAKKANYYGPITITTGPGPFMEELVKGVIGEDPTICVCQNTAHHGPCPIHERERWNLWQESRRK